MERKLEETGLNLNPMFCWKYVLSSRFEKRVPLVITFNVSQSETETLALNFSNADYLAFNPIPSGYIPIYDNVTFSDRKRKTDKEYLKMLSDTDYFYSRDKRACLEASLCGVRAFNDFEKMAKAFFSNPPKVLTKVERIENWEQAKKLLTF